MRENILAAAATAVAVSPRVRTAARKGLVYGLAGALKAGDIAVAAADGVARAREHGAMPSPGETTGQPRPRPARAATPDTMDASTATPAGEPNDP